MRELIRRRRPCRALVHHNMRPIEGLPVERVSGDVMDPVSLERAFQGAEVVYHLAARISLIGGQDGLVHDTNVVGTRNVVAACLAAGVRRLVHFSSIHAFQQRPFDEPLDETREKSGDEAPAYDRSKALAEREVLAGVERGLDAVIVNPTGVLGPFDFEPSAMGQVLLDLHHRRLAGLVAGGFNWVDVRDVINGALAAEARGRTGQNYLLGGHWVSVVEVAETVRQVTGVAPPWFVSPMWLARVGAPFAVAFAKVRGTRPLFTSDSLAALRSNRAISFEKATRELGYSPRPFRETIQDSFAWFREMGWV